MIKHYVKVALRNLVKQKRLSFINIIGLSIGLACFILFMLFAVNEFSYDRFHKKAANIYRVCEWVQGMPGREPRGDAFGGTPMGPALKADFADVKEYVRIQSSFNEKFVKAGESVSRSGLAFADPALFQVFSFPLLQGTAATALNDPHKVVLTKEKAIQLFGTTDVLGKRIDIKVENEFVPFTVGAVAADLPSNSSIRFSILGSYAYLMATDMGRESIDNWHMSIGSETYVLLRDGSTLKNDAIRLAGFRKAHMPNEEAELKREGIWNGKGPFPIRFLLQPLTEVHTNPKIGGIAETIDPKIIWILISIAAAILVIACINFTTLAIGRSAGRAKEVGVRKVTGSRRSQLVAQFLTESMLLSIGSALVGYFLALLILPYFNQLSGRTIQFSFTQYPQLLWLLSGLTVLTGFLAGIYPAFVLSRFNPIEVIKSRIRVGGANFFTKSLVTIQFILSVVLIISTFVIVQQINYMRSKNLGFNKENVVVIDAEGTDTKKIYPPLRQQLASNTTIMSVSASEMGLGEGSGLMGTAYDLHGETKGVIVFPVDAGYLKTMGMQLIAGRDFDPDFASDTVNSVIVNEALLRDFGLTVQNAVGQQLMERAFGGAKMPRKIIGVVKNFNYSSLNQEVRPQLFYQPAQLDARRIFIRIKSGDPSNELKLLTATWKKIVPDFPLRYSFLDEDMNRFYKMEERWSNVAAWAGGISIFLACLGLFGLAALAAVNRTKEIGIRKVLGASVSVIVRLLSMDFLKLVLLAIIIATPLAWFLMHKWLQEYAYRINISWWVFAATGILALVIA
ncbi:MAG: ABC transporter permease, partial [Flavisolibacter sp.]|nr:ABC transporter permease [Flavisolibacter sp.]